MTAGLQFKPEVRQICEMRLVLCLSVNSVEEGSDCGLNCSGRTASADYGEATEYSLDMCSDYVTASSYWKISIHSRLQGRQGNVEIA